ncbi:MAG: hypothetical protein ACRCYU_17040 [Nocardioides sp.]
MTTDAMWIGVPLAGALGLFLIAWRGRWTRTLVISASVVVAGSSLIAALRATADGPGAPDLAATVLIALTGLLAVAGGGPVTTSVFGLVTGESDHDTPGPIRRAGDTLRGGALIGALERAAIFGSLVAGWPEGLAVILGLKGLGRYPELRSQQSPGTAERFIIGTFTSALWACACAAIAHLLR